MGTADYCFSFFRKPIQNIEPIRAVGIVDVYRYITGHYAQPQTEALRLMATSPEAKRYKATHFDYCTFSGLFRKRNERELIMHSGLMCLDFDHVEDIMELKQKLLNHEYFDTELLFVSPSGNGLKWIIPVDLKGWEHFRYFKAVANCIKATGLSFQIDTAWVNRGAGYIKPQYLISVAHNDFAGTPGKPCTEDGPHVDKDGNITDAEHCVHATPAIPGFERAKYLVSFQDSVDVYGQDKPYADIKGGYTRVGFVEGIRVADTLWILPAEFVALANDKISFDALEAYNDSVKNLASKSYLIKNRLDGNEHKNYTWSFRYVHPENAGNVTEEGVENQFLFESNNYDNKIIAPENAAWLKIQNGCVVLTDKSSTFSHAATGGDGALIFNVENKVDDQLATDNEEIATSEVTVIALQGAVRVANAEGKKVVITNILGQTVANTVITSSDATIAAPQGVVVVAVEGEEAVKAIVK